MVHRCSTAIYTKTVPSDLLHGPDGERVHVAHLDDFASRHDGALLPYGGLHVADIGVGDSQSIDLQDAPDAKVL